MSKKIIILRYKTGRELTNLVIGHASSDRNDNITEPCIYAYSTAH